MRLTVGGAQLLSLALYAVPIVVWQVVRARPDRPTWAVALDVPFAVALDLLSILVLTRIVRLETAALVSRPAWIVGGAAIVAWRWRRRGVRPGWPVSIRARDLLAAAAAAALAVVSCSGISYKYLVWDMHWHVPLVSALSVQRIPFVNALSPKDVLHYHFAGDVLAVVIRTLSLDVISAPLALHTAHDAMFAAMAATLTLLSIGLGLQRWCSAVLGGVAVVLQGPIPLRGAIGRAFHGYAYHDFMNLSYRPHVPLAGLILIGAIGTLAVRAAHASSLGTRATLPVLFACVGQLAITDETSTGLVGLALGAAWLVDHRLVARKRLAGLFALIGLGFTFAGANRLFAASLAPGGPLQSVALTGAARMPGLSKDDALLAFATTTGKLVFVFDFLPLFACGAALVPLAWSLRSRAHAALAIFVWTLIAMCAALTLRVELNHDASESQRFFVAPFFACVVLGVVHLHRMPRGSPQSFLVLLGVAVPAVYSVYWTREQAPAYMDKEREGVQPWLTDNLFQIDCRVEAGAHLGDEARPTYVELTQFWYFESCRPMFNLGSPPSGPWPTRIYATFDPMSQLRSLDENLAGASEGLDALCRREDGPTDDVCRYALRVRSSCRPEGKRFLRCPLTPADRDKLLGRATPRAN